MSAEQWVQFKSPKELERVVKLLGDIVGGMISCGDVHVRVDRKSKTSLRISYQARFYRRELALLVTRELSRRFAVTRIGADAVGWYPDKDWTRYEDELVHDYGQQYKSWPEWIRNWKPEFSKREFGRAMPRLLEQIQILDSQVVELFDNLEKANELPNSVSVR